MKLMSPKNLFVSSLLPLFIISLLFAADISAQSKKNKPPEKAAAKKAETKKASASKDAKKKPAEQAAKNSKKDSKDEKLSSKEQAKAKEQLNAKGTDRSKQDSKKAAESRQAAAERRRKEEERRQAILAEQRRREQAIREAQARRLAFERGLRTETVANIANDKTEGEDLAIRQVAVNALGSHAGSVVVMEAQTGKVLTIVNQEWAIRSSIKPCSTIKLVTGVAGLNEGVVSRADGSIRDSSMRLNLDDALARSNNPYFQVVGSKVGNSKMIDYAKQLGLGEPTGLNVEGETAGRLAIGNNNARIYSHGDDFEVSTLQLAVMVSAISNGGIRVIPRTPRNTIEKTNFQTFYRKKVEVPQTNVRRVIPGMMGAAEYGTARRGVDASLGIAGKTGSCISKGTWVGLFASVAPIEKPVYSVVVITRGESERGRHAAAVAGQIYQALSNRIVRTDRNLAQTEFKLPARGGTTPATTVALIVEEEEGEDDIIKTAAVVVDGASQDGREVIVVSGAPKTIAVPRPAEKKLVTKTGRSKPIFPPVVITYDRDASTVTNGPGAKP